MKTLLIFGLVGAGVYAIWKYKHQTVLQVQADLKGLMPDLGGAPQGVTQFPAILTPNTPGQLQAWSEQLPDGTVSGIYSPAFGESTVAGQP